MGRSSSPAKDRPNHSANKSGPAEKKQTNPEAEVSSLAKKKAPRSRAKLNKAGNVSDEARNTVHDERAMTGQKRKSVQVSAKSSSHVD
jgi:hypothetical protein